MKTKKGQDWKPLYGLGKDLWKDEDAQEYVNQLREDRKPAGTEVPLKKRRNTIGHEDIDNKVS